MAHSKGDWHWTGHLHNSGFVGFDVVAAVRLNFVDAAGTGYATATNDGHVDGTSSTGDDTTFSWDQFGNAAVIRDNWDKGVAANGITTRVEVDATVGDVLSILFTGVIIVGSVLFAFGGDDNGVQACPGHRTSDGQQTPGSVVIYKKGELPPPCADDF